MELLQSFFEGPVLPATILMLVMVAWSGMAILSGMDLDLPGDVDVDLDLDVDMNVDISGHGVADRAADSLGVLAMKWLNLKQIPILMWICIFNIVWWLTSAVGWRFVESPFIESPGWQWSTLLVALHLGIALPLTKLVTTPMKPLFRVERLNGRSLVGQECEISSLEATPEFGQVRYKTEGSPLLLNVRTDGPHLAKGMRVWITHYDSKNHVYIVSSTGTGSSNTASENEESE